MCHVFHFWFADPVNEYPSDKAVHPSADFVQRVVYIVVRTSHFHDNCPRADVDNATLLPEAATDRHHPDQISDCDLPGGNRLPDRDHGFGQQHRVGINPIWACSATVVIALYGPTVGVIEAFCYNIRFTFAFRNAFLGNCRVDDFRQPCRHIVSSQNDAVVGFPQFQNANVDLATRVCHPGSKQVYMRSRFRRHLDLHHKSR